MSSAILYTAGMKTIFADDSLCFTLATRAILTPRRIKGLLRSTLFLMSKTSEALQGPVLALVAGDRGKHGWHITIDRNLSITQQRAFYGHLIDIMDCGRICKRELVSIGSKVIIPSLNENNRFVEYSYSGHHSISSIYKIA